MIGASARRGSIGGELFRNIVAGDFAGAAHPVNPHAEPVSGVRAYALDRRRSRTPVDLAVIAVPAERVLEAAEAALRAGVRALCVISAGFAEIGAEGAERQDALLALVRSHGGRLIGPNCLGIAVAGAAAQRHVRARRASPPATSASRRRAARSGSPSWQEAAARGLGLSAFVSIGNKADVSSNDLLEHWEDDAATELDAALPRVVRQPAPLRRGSRAGWRAASRSWP